MKSQTFQRTLMNYAFGESSQTFINFITAVIERNGLKERTDITENARLK